MPQTDTFRGLAEEAARRGGEVLKRFYGAPGPITMKPGGAGPVTDADVASQAAIVEALRPSALPVFAEEEGLDRDPRHRRWVVDPLDGTANFIRQLPWFCLGIALAAGDDVELGVVYAPLTDELFVAERGKGTTLNGKRQWVSKVQSLRDSCLLTSCDRNWCREPARIDRLARVARGVGELRSPNAAVLDLAYVSAGRVDGFWEQSLAPWDLAAGSLLVREAGGTISNLRGDSLALHSNEIAATNGWIHGELIRVLTG
jgi:myo-inositol-1(or 4)-monophosphatase